MKRYFAAGWSAPDGSVAFASPLSVSDLAGAGVNGSTACRSVNVILVTDGDETCDAQADAVAAAADLYQQGVTVGGKTFKVRTHVVNFAGGTQANTDAIAAAGGTGSSIFASNAGELEAALSSIVTSAVKPETCNNGDDSYNGCTDEGYRHHCNLNPACCAWSDASGRKACLDAYATSVTASPPLGDRSLLPCTSVSQAATPAAWLCQDPGETCNSKDDNCQSRIDEHQLTCGSPAHCPSTETCNGTDDDCDGVIDDGFLGTGCTPVGHPPGLVYGGSSQCTRGTTACVNGAVVCQGGTGPSAELCDGKDNDCDGVVDDAAQGAGKPCGSSTPPCTPGVHRRQARLRRWRFAEVRGVPGRRRRLRRERRRRAAPVRRSGLWRRYGLVRPRGARVPARRARTTATAASMSPTPSEERTRRTS
ncbi:MAG: putative metal-binding motif-containing protein [Deltaproteobacteria bacterium]|nr:putative metal-binding motif-containing protein [Deltaproteobacteria bacterium]